MRDEMTPAELDIYRERLAICTAEGISEQRAAEIAAEQIERERREK